MRFPMRFTLPVRLCVLLIAPFGTAIAQSSALQTSAAPQEVRRVRSLPATPRLSATPARPRQERAEERGQIGVYLGGVSPERSGANINSLVPGGAAESAGLQAGDRILAIDGKRVTNSEELITIVKSKRAGDTVELLVDRDGWRKRLDVQLRAPQSAQVDAPRWAEVEELQESEGSDSIVDPREGRVAEREPERRRAQQRTAELEELRKLIEGGDAGSSEEDVERHVWIDDEDLAPEALFESEDDQEWFETPAPRRERVEGRDGEQRLERRDRELRLERRDREQRLDRRDRRQRLERAERFRQQHEIERRRRAESELRRRAERERETAESPRRGSELDSLRAELDALRREVEALRRELDARARRAEPR